MKRFINFFVLAGVLAIVATSCYKDDIDNLQKQIDALKSGEIATIETQISSINTSITELKSVDNTLKEYITALQSDSKKYAQQIADLTAMDKTLETKIADLQKYVDSGIKDTKDWASATFATLDQMDSLCTVVAAIPPQIKAIQTQLDSVKKSITGDYTKAIEAAMTKLETSMKKWVSEQLADYYTIAQINATLDSLGKFQSKVDSAMVEKIKGQQVALDTAKSQITAAYKKAIQVAIDSLQGKFDIKLATEIATAKNALQAQIDTINTEITNIKSRLATAEGNIAALVNQIQSIVVIPQYSDGSVSYTGGVDILSFDIYPTSVAQAIATAWKGASAEARKSMVSFTIKEVATKKSGPTATVDTVFFTDNEFKVGVKFERLPDNAMASLHIASGATDVASKFFGLTQTENYFYFEAVKAGAKVALVTSPKKEAPTDPSLLYSTDGGTNWTEYNIAAEVPSVGLTAGQRIYFKAKTTNTAFGAAGSYDFYCFTATDSVKVGGNIMYLLNGSNPDDATLSSYCFKGLFKENSFIVSASDLKLPANKLSDNCYRFMFMSCKNLKTAPALPATELADTCYYQMFTTCHALEAAPALPATTLKTLCYSAMFQGCTTLVAAPPLPASELAISCYNQMFNNCYALVTAPALNATTLASKCYFKMFCDCIALENPPALPATELADNCYENMFSSCSTLVAAPLLPATKLKKGCYQKMFNKCVKLSSVTMLATDVLAGNCLKEWLAEGAGEDASVKNLFVDPSMVDNDSITVAKGDFTVYPYYSEAPGMTATKIDGNWWAPVNCGYDANHPYGLLYQWGRKYGQGYDGETPAVDTTNNKKQVSLEEGNNPDNKNKFYYGNNNWSNSTSTTSDDWFTTYNPCPSGWRVPTQNEFNALTAYYSSWTTKDGQNGYYFSGITAYSESVPRVFLPAGGQRDNNGDASKRGTQGFYSISTAAPSSVHAASPFYFDSTTRGPVLLLRSCGFSVRCIKEGSTGPT